MTDANLKGSAVNSSIVETTVAPPAAPAGDGWARVAWFATSQEAAAFRGWVVSYAENVPQSETDWRVVPTADCALRHFCPHQLDVRLPVACDLNELFKLSIAFINGWTCGARAAREAASK